MEGETLMAKLKVQSGSATQVAGKVIDTLLNGINKWFQSFADYEKDLGWNKKREEKIEKDGKQGVKAIYETGSGELIEVGILQQERNLDYCDLYAEATDNSLPVLEKHDLKISEVHKAIADWADDNNLGTIEDMVIDDDTSAAEEEVESAKKIQVTLKRVCGATEDTISMTAVKASYPIVLAMEDLNAILQSDEFASTITEEPQSFEIVEVPEDEEFDIQVMEQPVDTSSTYEEMLKATVVFYNNILAIKWGAGESNEVRNWADNFVWSVRNHIDTLAEWMIEKTHCIPHVGKYAQCGTIIDTTHSSISIEAFKEMVREQVELLEAFYVNLDHDMQSVVDAWIREYNRTLDYVLAATDTVKPSGTFNR